MDKTFEPVAGNGLLDRRLLLRRGLAFAGMAAGSAATGAAAEPLAGRAVEPRAGPHQRGAGDALEIRGRRQAHPEQSPGPAANAARPHAAPVAERHHHAELAALHHHPQRHAGHRPGAAQARHPRAGEAAAGVHRRGADALSDGDGECISSNAAATARRCSPTSRSRPRCSSCTASSRAPNGPACGSPPCSKKPASTPRPSG